MEITKKKDGYQVSGLNQYGRFVEIDVTGLETIEEVELLILSKKSKLEAEKEKEEKDKEFLLDEFVKGKSEDELLSNKNIFPNLKEGLKLKEGKIYNYIGELYKALESFTYDMQLSPILEPGKYQKLGQPQESEYQKLLKKATHWSRDNSYKAGDLVIWYSKLYRAKERIATELEPGKSDKWELIPNETV